MLNTLAPMTRSELHEVVRYISRMIGMEEVEPDERVSDDALLRVLIYRCRLLASRNGVTVESPHVQDTLLDLERKLAALATQLTVIHAAVLGATPGGTGVE
jgi:hypothetical protein